MTEQIAILRKCHRCGGYRSIARFTGLGVLCRGCTASDHRSRPVSRIAPARGYALTAKARAFLAYERTGVR